MTTRQGLMAAQRIPLYALSLCLAIASVQSAVDVIVVTEFTLKILHCVLAILSIITLFALYSSRARRWNPLLVLMSLAVVAGFYLVEGLWVLWITFFGGLSSDVVFANVSYALFTFVLFFSATHYGKRLVKGLEA